MYYRRRAVVALGTAAVVVAVAVGATGAFGSADTTAPETTTTTTTVPETTTTTIDLSFLNTTTAPPQVEPIESTDGLAPVINRVPTSDPVIFLTIDDGAVRDPRALDFVAANGIPVDLFLNESYLRADPDYFRRFASYGGAIHTHTLNHPDLTKLGAGGQEVEICGMIDRISEAGLRPGYLFRAPYGNVNSSVRRVAAGCGISAVMHWSATINNGAVQLASGPGLRPGDVVLTHFRNDLYDNLVEIKRMADAAGLRFAALQSYIGPP